VPPEGPPRIEADTTRLTSVVSRRGRHHGPSGRQRRSTETGGACAQLAPRSDPGPFFFFAARGQPPSELCRTANAPTCSSRPPAGGRLAHRAARWSREQAGERTAHVTQVRRRPRPDSLDVAGAGEVRPRPWARHRSRCRHGDAPRAGARRHGELGGAGRSTRSHARPGHPRERVRPRDGAAITRPLSPSQHPSSDTSRPPTPPPPRRGRGDEGL